VGAVTAAWIRLSEPDPAPAADRDVLAEAREGLVFLWQHPLVRSISLTILATNSSSRLSAAVFVLLFVGRLGLTPAQLGLTFAAASVSSLAGAQLAKPLIDRLGVGPIMVSGTVLLSVGLAFSIPAALAPRPWVFPLLVAGSLVLGFGLMTYNVNQQAIRGAVIPNQMLGRVSAGLFVLVAVGNVAGALVGGILGQSIGLFGTLVVATVLGAAGALPAIFSPLSRLRGVPAPE